MARTDGAVRSRATLTLGATLVALLLAACGGDDERTVRAEPPPRPETNGIAEQGVAKAFDRARRAMRDLEDATYAGTALWPPGTPLVAGQSTRLRIRYADGNRCEVTMRLENGGAITMLRVGGDAFVSLDARAVAAVDVPADRRPVIDGRWVAVPPDDLRSQCSLVEGGLRDPGGFEQRSAGEVGGRAGMRYRGLVGYVDVVNRVVAEVWIATEGTPLVAATSVSGAGLHLELELESYDDGIEIEAPPEHRVLREPALELSS